MVIDDDGDNEYLDLCMCLLWGGRCRQMDVQHRLHILTLNLQHTEIHNGNGKSQFVTPLKVNLDQNSFVSNCWDLVLRKEHTFGKGEGSQCWVYKLQFRLDLHWPDPFLNRWLDRWAWRIEECSLALEQGLRLSNIFDGRGTQRPETDTTLKL